jgi:hypothetical protein
MDSERYTNRGLVPASQIEDLLETLWFRREETRSTGPTAELHVCSTCGSDLVYPTDWTPAGTSAWAVDLRCPECEWTGNGVYSQEIVDRFDLQLDLGIETLIEDLTRLTRANMEDEVERFSEGLRRGHILPEDF